MFSGWLAVYGIFCLSRTIWHISYTLPSQPNMTCLTFRMISQTELMAHDVTSPINSKTPRTTAYQKTHESWGSVLGSAFLANYLVNLGVWQATAAQDIVSKIFATLFPVGAFVTMGFNHLIGEIPATLFQSRKIWSHYLLSPKSLSSGSDAIVKFPWHLIAVKQKLTLSSNL